MMGRELHCHLHLLARPEGHCDKGHDSPGDNKSGNHWAMFWRRRKDDGLRLSVHTYTMAAYYHYPEVRHQVLPGLFGKGGVRKWHADQIRPANERVIVEESQELNHPMAPQRCIEPVCKDLTAPVIWSSQYPRNWRFRKRGSWRVHPKRHNWREQRKDPNHRCLHRCIYPTPSQKVEEQLGIQVITLIEGPKWKGGMWRIDLTKLYDFWLYNCPCAISVIIQYIPCSLSALVSHPANPFTSFSWTS